MALCMLLSDQITERYETSEQKHSNINMEVLMIEVAERCLGFETKQKEATIEFVRRKDVFILLLAGYVKHVYYATIPLIFDLLRGNIGSLVLVVSPLNALVKGQVESFKSKRLEAGILVLDVGFVC